MRSQSALRLLSGDEIKIKATGEVKIVSHVISQGKPNKYGYHVVVVTQPEDGESIEYRNSEIC